MGVRADSGGVALMFTVEIAHESGEQERIHAVEHVEYDGEILSVDDRTIADTFGFIVEKE